MSEAARENSARVLDACRARGWTLVTAESCTGGLVGSALTDIAGSSDVFDRGYITYSNTAKQMVLGVPADVLRAYGAVSQETAEAMAKGALARAKADASVAITGIAGPGGGTSAKPVGLVHFAAATRDGTLLHRERRYGDLGRAEVRRRSVEDALQLLLEALGAAAGAATGARP